MQLISDNIQDKYGNAIAGASVLITMADTGLPAVLYADNAGTTKANPLTTNKEGEFSFYAENGRYVRTVSWAAAQPEPPQPFEVADLLELAGSSQTALDSVLSAKAIVEEQAYAVALAAPASVSAATAAETAAAAALARSTAAALSKFYAEQAAQVADAARLEISGRYRGALTADPATRPDGTANQPGDYYANSSSTPPGLVRVFISAASGWQTINLNMASLAATDGASLLGFDGGTAQDVLDNAKPMANYTALRNYTGRATGVRITSQGLAGYFQRLGTAGLADNGGTIIIDALGRAWERLFVGAVNVKWFGAKGDWNGTTGTDDTAAIQAAMNACVVGLNHCKALHIPPSNYKVSASLVIPVSGAGNFDIQAHGARLKAAPGMTDYMLSLTMVNYNGNNLKIHGLIIDGNYTAKGLYLNGAQEWALSGVKILSCVEGLRIKGSYYGEIAAESMIRDCLVGLTLGDTLGGEVNTIKFDNLKINFGVAKTLFVAMNVGEALADYNTRVPSIGVNLQSVMLGVKFKGLTCEGMDYGFWGLKANFGETGASYSLLKISECYFESIKVSPISIRAQVGYGLTSALVAEISNCHFAETLSCLLGPGRWRMFGNSVTARVKLFNAGISRSNLTTDMPKSSIELEDATGSVTSVDVNYRTTQANPWRHAAYGSNDTYPVTSTALPAAEDDNIAILPALVVASGMAEYNRVLGVTGRPVTWAKLQNKVPNGPVIVGDDGFYYMLGTASGTTLKLTRVFNLHRLERQLNCYDALELYRNTALPAGQYKVVEFATANGAAYRITKDGAGKLLHTDGTIKIGTGAEIAAQVKGASYGSPTVWNAQINSGYNWYGDHWNWGPDWYGATSTDRAIGTAAQRPATPSVAQMVYYATDTATYTEWKNAAWGAYTPLF